MLYTFAYSFEAENEAEAQERLEELIAQEGAGPATTGIVLMLDADDTEGLARTLMGIDTYGDEDDPVVQLKRLVYPLTDRAWLLAEDETQI